MKGLFWGGWANPVGMIWKDQNKIDLCGLTCLEIVVSFQDCPETAQKLKSVQIDMSEFAEKQTFNSIEIL